MSEVGLGLLIVAGVWTLVALAGEVSARLGARHFRDDGPEFERYARRRLRRAYWDGVGSCFALAPSRGKRR